MVNCMFRLCPKVKPSWKMASTDLEKRLPGKQVFWKGVRLWDLINFALFSKTTIKLMQINEQTSALGSRGRRRVSRFGICWFKRNLAGHCTTATEEFIRLPSHLNCSWALSSAGYRVLALCMLAKQACVRPDGGFISRDHLQQISEPRHNSMGSWSFSFLVGSCNRFIWWLCSGTLFRTEQRGGENYLSFSSVIFEQPRYNPCSWRSFGWVHNGN